jgi:hypothetical protein
MNTLTPARQRVVPDHPPNTDTPSTRTARSERVRLLDRLALRVGVALVQWSRRSRVAVRHERRAARVTQQLATARRERAHERALRLLVPPR